MKYLVLTRVGTISVRRGTNALDKIYEKYGISPEAVVVVKL